MVALALMEVARTIFTNHLYQFKGQVYKQKDGGPIGDNATNIAADLIMFSFIGGYRRKLQKFGLNDSIKLLKSIRT